MTPPTHKRHGALLGRAICCEISDACRHDGCWGENVERRATAAALVCGDGRASATRAAPASRESPDIGVFLEVGVVWVSRSAGQGQAGVVWVSRSDGQGQAGVVWVSRSARRGRVVRRSAAGTQGELSRPKLLSGVTGRSWEGACCIRVDGDVRETRETRSRAVNPYPRPLGAGKATFRQTLNRCDAPTPLGVAGVRCKPRVPGSTPRERERLSSRSRANGNQDLCHYLIHVA